MRIFKSSGIKRYVIVPILAIGILTSYMRPSVMAAGTDEAKKAENKQKMSALEQSIKEKEGEISKAKTEKDSLTKGKTDVEALKKSLEQSKANLSAYVQQLDEQVVAIETNIENLKLQITAKEEEIKKTKEELKEAIQMRDDQYAAMEKRVQAIYESGDSFYLEILLKAGGLADFINQFDYVEDLSRYDDKMFQDYANTVEYVSLCEQQLEAEEEVLEATKKAAEDEQAAVEELISEKQTEIASVENEIQDKERAIREYEQEISEQNETIQELERIVAAEKAALTNLRVYDGGKFCWPAPSYTRVSSEYGYRMHPTLGIEQFHNGVDLAAPGGTNILAAYDGTVVSASYTAAMGNYVMIDHGGGLYTIYMHASKLLVKEGQDVSRGDVIALVGTTGRSTGNHLHFSVRLNGDYVSPWNYITKP